MTKCIVRAGIVILIVIITLGTTAEAQRNFDTVQIRSTQVTDAVWMLTGSGGNIGVCSGEDGTFIIDDQFAPLTQKIERAISALGPSVPPVKLVINTHWHGDHTGGNENLSNDGAIIIAHENVRKRMSEEHFNEFFKRTSPPAPKAALPIVTFTEDIAIHLNGDDVQVFHVNPAHTDGDAIVLFTKANVVHMGDVFFSASYPIVDVSSGGSINGMVAAVDRLLPMLNDDVKIIPGHGPLANKSNLRSYREMLASIRDAVVDLIRKGKTLDEVKKAKSTKDFDYRWGSGAMSGDRFVEMVYQSLAKR